MIQVDSIHDAIMVELGNRLFADQPCSCDAVHTVMIQNCACLADPNEWITACSECGTPYLEELLD